MPLPTCCTHPFGYFCKILSAQATCSRDGASSPYFWLDPPQVLGPPASPCRSPWCHAFFHKCVKLVACTCTCVVEKTDDLEEHGCRHCADLSTHWQPATQPDRSWKGSFMCTHHACTHMRSAWSLQAEHGSGPDVMCARVLLTRVCLCNPGWQSMGAGLIIRVHAEHGGRPACAHRAVGGHGLSAGGLSGGPGARAGCFAARHAELRRIHNHRQAA
eukprot:scaffold319089_cov24-Tisochrysis_lutea.AAC.1